MLIDVSLLERFGELQINEKQRVVIDDYSGDVSLIGHVAEIDGAYEFNGYIEGVIHTSCSRCLKELAVPYKRQIRQVFSKKDALTEGGLDGEDDEVLWFTGHKADFISVVTGVIRGDMPIAIVCEDSCKGLCPVCGTNLNVSYCGCADNYRNPAFEKLKDFFNEHNTP